MHIFICATVNFDDDDDLFIFLLISTLCSSRLFVGSSAKKDLGFGFQL